LTISRLIGFELWSYSLQYPQARLQRRIGIKCARTGWRLESRARVIKLASRTFSFRNFVFLIESATGSPEKYATKAVQRNRAKNEQINQGPCFVDRALWLSFWSGSF